MRHGRVAFLNFFGDVRGLMDFGIVEPILCGIWELGRKVRQTLPTLLFVDPAGGKVKKRALLCPASHMSLAIHFSNCNNKRLTLTNISLNIVNNIKNNNNRNRVLALLSSSF